MLERSDKARSFILHNKCRYLPLVIFFIFNFYFFVGLYRFSYCVKRKGRRSGTGLGTGKRFILLGNGAAKFR